MIERVVEIYNEHCDVLPSVQSINSARERRVRKIIKEHGFDEACDLIRRATLAVANDDFWRSRRKYGFDNLLAGDKYLQKAETWVDGGEVGVDVKEGTRVLFSMTLGMREMSLPGVIERVESKQYVVKPDDTDEAIGLPRDVRTYEPESIRIPHSHVIRRL